MEDWLGDRQDILTKARPNIDLLTMGLEQVRISGFCHRILPISLKMSGWSQFR